MSSALLDRIAVVASDDERRTLVKHFARLCDLTTEYPGSAAPARVDEPIVGRWASWAFDDTAALACCLVQPRRSANAESPPPLYVLVRGDDAHTLYRLRTAAAYSRLMPNDQVTYPSVVLDGHLLLAADSPVPLFVAWQCLWLAGNSRRADDAQTRMSVARSLVECEPLAANSPANAVAPLRRVDEWLRFAYRPHQTPIQWRSITARPLPPPMAAWPIRADAIELRATDAEADCVLVEANSREELQRLLEC